MNDAAIRFGMKGGSALVFVRERTIIFGGTAGADVSAAAERAGGSEAASKSASIDFSTAFLRDRGPLDAL